MKINEFKTGDALTRTSPPKGVGDRSYIGDGYRLIGIANGVIYCKVIHDRLSPEHIGEVLEIPSDLYDDNNWEPFIDPARFESNFANRIKIEREILEAAVSGDYERIEILRKVLLEL